MTKPSLPSDSALPSSAQVSDLFVRIDQTLHFQRACAPSKSCQNQKSFWIPSKQPLNTCIAGCTYFFFEKHVFVKHPSGHIVEKMYDVMLEDNGML